jgi:hypothetical protein
MNGIKKITGHGIKAGDVLINFGLSSMVIINEVITDSPLTVRDGFVMVKLTRKTPGIDVSTIVTCIKLDDEFDVVSDTEAQTLINAPYADQYNFICTAPEGVWQEVLKIVFGDACPKYWANKRANYNPDWQAKAAKKQAKRAKQRKAYARNGRSAYPSKKDRLNGCTANLEVV